MEFRINQNNESVLEFHSGKWAAEPVALLHSEGTVCKVGPSDIMRQIAWDKKGYVELIADGQVQGGFHTAFFAKLRREVCEVLHEAALAAATAEKEKADAG